MKRIKAFLAIGIIGSMILTGCQKAAEPGSEQSTIDKAGGSEAPTQEETTSENSNSSNSENGEDTTDTNSVEEDKNMASASDSQVVYLASKDDANTKDATGQNASSVSSDLLSGLRIIHKDNDYYGEDYTGLIIGHNYEQLGISDDLKKAYPELEQAVLMVNDLIATDEANCYYAAYRQVSKNDKDETYEHPVSDMNWNIFVRRADKDVLSILVKITTASYEDYNHDRYLSYNIKPDTGEVINLSDIIEDEDSLYDKLAEKFYEVMEADRDGFFATSDITEANIDKTLKESAYEDQLVWTLDPQGVSFWLSSMVLAPVSINAKILFCEDDKGQIFTSDVRENIPDTWITQLYPNANELIDADDDGKQDTIYVMEQLEYYVDSDYQYTSGILIDFNGKEYEFPVEGDDYDYEFSLVHQNGKSSLLSQFKDYETDIMELYKLDEKSVESTDLITAFVFDDPDEEFNDFDEYAYVTPIVTDPSHFLAATVTWLLSTANATFEYRITDEGKFQNLSERGMIIKSDRYEITTRVAMDGVPVVDAATGEPTGETVNLLSGAKLKLMYTDINNYVDCLTEYNRLVRIYVFMDDDFGKYIKVNDEKVSVQTAFDNMFYAG